MDKKLVALFRLLAVAIVFVLSAQSAEAQTTTTGSGSWSSTTPDAPWPGGIVPPSTENITVGAGFTLTVDVPSTCNSITAGAGATISNASNLTVTTNLTGSGSLIQGTNAILSIGGTSTITTFTATANSNTVIFAGAGAQTIRATTYHHLTTSGGGSKTAAITTVNGDLSIGNGTILAANNTLFVTGVTTVGGGTSGTITFGTAGAKTFVGPVTISNGATWTNATENVVFRGDITNNGTFTAGTGLHTFNTNPQVLTGIFTIPNVTVTSPAVLTNTNTLTVNTALSGSGGITQGNNAILSIGGTSTITNMTATAAGNTVNYTGAAQTVKNVNYVNLGLSGSGVKTLQVGTTAITGNLSLSGTVASTGVIGLTIGGNVNIGSGTTFTSGAFTHNVAGNWTNNGTFTGTGSTIILNGATQNITGGSTTFNDLTLAGSGIKVFGVATTMLGTLSINTGVVADLGVFTTHTALNLVLGGALQSTTGIWGGTASNSPPVSTNDTYFLSTSVGEITIIAGGFNYYSIADGDWDNPNTWSNTGFGGVAGVGTPGINDYVFIGRVGGGVRTVTVIAAATCSEITFDAGTAVTNTLTVNSGITLAVSGGVTIPQTVTSGSNILNVGAGTLTSTHIDFTATGSGAGHQMTISTGTATVSGNVTGIGASSTVQFTGAGLMQLGGAFYTATNGTLTMVAGSTVEYNGAAAQTVQAHVYQNLTLSGGNTKTLSINATISGNLTVGNNTTFAIGGIVLVVTGTTTVGTNGTLSITSTTGNKTFVGLVTINSSGTWSNLVNEAITFQGGITNNGTFNSGTGSYTFSTNSQTLIGTFAIPNVSVIGAAVMLTNTNSLTVQTALSGTGGITQGGGATLNIGGTSGITTLTTTAAGNTVNYTGAAQTVKNVNYVNLGLSGTLAKTLQVGTTAITGDLTFSGTVSVTGVTGLTIGGDVNIGAGTTFISGAFTHNVAGDWINNGTFTGTANGAVNLNGAGTQNISGVTTIFYDLILSGSGNKVFGVKTDMTEALEINTGAVADLGSLATHTAARLLFNGVQQSSTGTWGSSASGAANTNDIFFLVSSSGEIFIGSGGNNFYSIADGDWNNSNTWSNTGFGGTAGAGTPTVNDHVFIGRAGVGVRTVTISAAGATCKELTFDSGSTVTNTLTINSGFNLTVTDVITIPQTVTSGSNILDVGAGTLTATNIDFTATASGVGHRMVISTGTATVSGNITGIGASSTIQFTGTGLLQLGGSIFSSANGTLTSVAGSTVEYTGAAQTIQALGYNNLLLSGGGTKTLAASTTIGGNLAISDGVTFAVGAVTLAVNGSTTVGGGTSGSLSLISTVGTKTFTGLVTISPNAIWNNSGNEGVAFQGGITNNGTFTAGTGTNTFNTNSQALTGSFVIPNVTVTGAAVSLTNTNSLTVNTALSGSGGLTQGTGATLNIGGTSGIANLTATASGNTVNYTGATQTVHSNVYVNLILSGNGVKTLQAGTTSITGDFTLSGSASTTGAAAITISGDVTIGLGTTFTSGAFNHNVSGDWINNGTFVGTASGSITLNGAGQQNISGNATTFYDLILSGSGNKVFQVVTTMVDLLSINSGAVADLGSITTHSANRLILDGVLQNTPLQNWGSTGSIATNKNDTYFLSTSSGAITITIGGNTFYSRASGAWNVNTTWSPTGFGGASGTGTPTASDLVYIGGGFTVTVTGAENCSTLFFNAGLNVTNTLDLNAGSLTVAGNIIIPQTETSGSNILDVGAGTLTASDLDFTSTPGGSDHELIISTGTVIITGNIVGTDAGSTIEFTDAGTLRVGGSMFTSTNGTLIAPSGTVEYNGTAQTIQALAYRNLTLSGSGNKTLAATTIVTGNLAIGDNVTFTIGAVSLNVNGTTTVGGGTSGILSITSATGVKTFTGLITINSNGTWSNATENVSIQGGITNNGTFTAGTGIYTFSSNSQVLTGSFAISNVTVTGAAVTLTNTNTLTINTALGGIGGIIQGAGATLNIGGTSGITTMTATAAGNTVNYTGAGQTVKNVNYVNLGLSGSGVKTLAVGTTSITGNLSLSGTVSATGVIGLTIGGNVDIGSGTTFTSGAFTHSVGGNFINNGTFNSGLGTVSFNGSAPQTISGSTVTDFNNITITNTSGPPSILVESNQNLLGVLSLASNSLFDADGSSNSSVFTLLSSGDSPTQDASIAALPAGAAVIGDVTIQRYMAIEGANSGRIYRYISSPVQNVSVSQIQSEIPVTGSFTGTSPCTGCGSSQSMFLYNESIITDTNGSGGNTVDDGYEDFPAASNSETLTSGRGYTIFVRGNIDPVLSNGSARWDVTGTINSGTIDFTPFTTFTSSGIPANDGWNLIGNPYPSTIDWDAAGWTKTGINNAIYMRDNGLISPLYATYIGGVGVNGGSQFIASGQAFFVKSDGGPITLQATESVKAAGTQTTFFREAAINDMVRVALKKGNIIDETVVRFHPVASDSFDPAMDAYKLKNAVFNLASVSGTVQYAINALPTLACSSSVSLDISNAVAGTYQLGFSQFESFSNSVEITLFDGFLGQYIDVRKQTSYEFQVTADSKSMGSRFQIGFAQSAINAAIVPEGPSTLCIGNEYQVKLPSTEAGVGYYASLNGTVISESFIGTGGVINLEVDESKLVQGQNEIVISGKRATCETVVPLLKSVKVTVDNLYQIQAVTGGTSCQAGSVTLSATGAPVDGMYHWYETSESVALISGSTGNSFTTPVLNKSKTYFVAAVNNFGCEGERKPVKAEVIIYDPVSISETSAGILTSNYATGNIWYLNDNEIPGATTQSIAVTESGMYKAEVIMGTCKSSSERQYVVTGLEEKSTGIGIYPNPVVEEVSIRGLENIKVIKLISSTGQQVHSEVVNNRSIVTLDMKEYPAGLYLIKLLDKNNSTSTHKIIKR